MTKLEKQTYLETELALQAMVSTGLILDLIEELAGGGSDQARLEKIEAVAGCAARALKISISQFEGVKS